MKIGFLSLPLAGHLNPMTAIARKLQSRGHESIFLGVPDSEAVVRAAGLDFIPFGENEYPPGAIAEKWAPIAKLRGLDVVRYSFRELTPGLIKAAFEHLPDKIAETDVDAVILDTTYRLIELVPMHLGLPYIQIWNVLHFDLSGSTPLALYSWPHETTPAALARNVDGLQIFREAREVVRPIGQVYAERNGIEIDWTNPAATVSKLAVITQTPREFDFPISNLPPQFHYAGPFHDDEGREPVPFPWEKLTGEPLIYASMGTLVNGLKNVYGSILEAVSRFRGMQAVLSVGKNVNPGGLGPIPSNTIVVAIAPQNVLLKRAALCITHAGLNTTLEALAQGVPMVAIPIGYDQPGVAARIAHHGVGEFIEIGNLTARNLSELIGKVTTNPGYRDNARRFQEIIAKTRGLDLAADIVERVFGERVEAKPGEATMSFSSGIPIARAGEPNRS
jgi:zeaxanthin glucosyltransferase